MMFSCSFCVFLILLLLYSISVRNKVLEKGPTFHKHSVLERKCNVFNILRFFHVIKQFWSNFGPTLTKLWSIFGPFLVQLWLIFWISRTFQSRYLDILAQFVWSSGPQPLRMTVVTKRKMIGPTNMQVLAVALQKIKQCKLLVF